MDRFSRSLPLLTEAGLQKLQNARVCVFGLGGVGAACAEALVRAGIGHITFVDGDSYSLSNFNRQLYAEASTLGENKAKVAAARARAICPETEAVAVPSYYVPGEAFDLSLFDYLCDCIDDVPAKVDLICRAKAENVYILSAMGAGGKTDPARFRVADLAKTNTCPLAKKMRIELKKHGIVHTPVVFSDEPPRAVASPPASLSFVPPAAGFVMAGEVVRTLAGL